MVPIVTKQPDVVLHRSIPTFPAATTRSTNPFLLPHFLYEKPTNAQACYDNTYVRLDGYSLERRHLDAREDLFVDQQIYPCLVKELNLGYCLLA